jgi:hypothetical protein
MAFIEVSKQVLLIIFEKDSGSDSFVNGMNPYAD